MMHFKETFDLGQSKRVNGEFCIYLLCLIIKVLHKRNIYLFFIFIVFICVCEEKKYLNKNRLSH